MAINVAGTNALGGYLASEIANARTLFGETPQSAPAAPAALTKTTLAAQSAAQELANMQTLFGTASSSNESANALPPIAGETSAQIAQVAVQSSYIAAEQSNVETLFGSLGLGANTDRVA